MANKERTVSFLNPFDGMISGSSSKRNTSSGLPKYRSGISFGDVGRTPGTASHRTVKSFITLAVVEGRGKARGEIGMASMDALGSHVYICQFVDSPSYANLRVQIQILQPVEIILPDICERRNNMSAIAELITTSYPQVEITTVNRRYFSDVKGVELIQQLGSVEASNIGPDISKKYYCMAAAAALIKYVEFIQNVLFAQGSLKIIYRTNDKTCFVDINTLRNIEMIECSYSNVRESNRSLLTIINKCLTGGGTRMLRTCLLQPSADSKIISSRCDVIEELLGNQPKFERLRAIIGTACDIQQLVTVCCYIDNDIAIVRNVEQKLLQVLNLKHALNLVGPLKVALKSSKAELLKMCYNHLCDDRFGQIIDRLNERLDATAGSSDRSALANRFRKCYAVKAGSNAVIELARRGFEEVVRDLEEKAEEEMKGVPGARLVFTAQRGYHISIPCLDPISRLKLPPHFVQEVRNRASLSCTTKALMKYNDRVNDFVNEIMLGSNSIIMELLDEIRTLIPCLYQLIEVISMLDFICCLVMYAMKVPTVRPTFEAANAVVIKQGRHPILDLVTNDVIANDTYLSRESRLAIVTGPNMAGKSIYLRQVCLLQMLAQAGSFVPAEFGAFPLITRIFARVGHNDDLTNNYSAFALEMSEMAPILAAADSSSVIIIDELARSTAEEEAMALCYAICEELLKIRAFTVFATHYLDLCSLESNYSAVENYHFSLQSETVRDEDGIEKEVLRSNHRLYRGYYKGPLYGSNLVEMSTLPAEIINNARELAEKLRAAKEPVCELSEDVRKTRALLKLGCKLQSMLPVLAKSDPIAAGKYLNSLREKYITECLPSASRDVAACDNADGGVSGYSEDGLVHDVDNDDNKAEGAAINE